MPDTKFKINRAPVMTLWAVVVAERLGYPAETALTLAKVVTGMNAQSKGRRLGIYEEEGDGSAQSPSSRENAPKPEVVELLGRSVPAVTTPQGLRAVEEGRPIDPRAVQRYLERKYGEHLDEARAAMTTLAEAFPPKELGTRAFGLYSKFRPEVPEGARGWGAVGELDLEKVRELAKNR